MSAGLRKLSAVVYATGPTPCERYGCAMQARCAAQELLCDAFRVYILNGRAILPTSVVSITGETVTLCEPAAAPQPTREKFVSAYHRRPVTAVPVQAPAQGAAA